MAATPASTSMRARTWRKQRARGSARHTFPRAFDAARPPRSGWLFYELTLSGRNIFDSPIRSYVNNPGQLRTKFNYGAVWTVGVRGRF